MGFSRYSRIFTKRSHSFHLVTAVLIVELCGLCLLEWPLLYNFNKFAFGDWGGYLVTHYLVQQGYMPITDFSWQYGLLPLLLQELWFRLVAASPATFMMLSLPCGLLFTRARARFTNLETTAPGHALVLFSLPFIVGPGADLPHALEPVLLSAGLLLQA